MAGRTVAGTFSIVRPYPGQLGKTVERFVAGLDLTPALGVPPPIGTSDEHTARWLSRTVAQLLVVPFHFHRGADQSRLDGIGALLALAPSFDVTGRVLFMPVRSFSWTTSFQPRYDLLKSERPQLAEHLIVAEESELESPALYVRVKRALDIFEERRTRPPTQRPSAQRPSSQRPGERTPVSGDALHRLAERFSLPPKSQSRRASGAWKFSLPEVPSAEEQFGTVPPVSGPRVILDEPVGIRPIYEDFIDRKKSSG